MPLDHINGQWLRYEDSGGNHRPVILVHDTAVPHTPPERRSGR